MMGRVELVNFVIYSSLSYSFQVYRWPSNFLSLLINGLETLFGQVILINICDC